MSAQLSAASGAHELGSMTLGSAQSVTKDCLRCDRPPLERGEVQEQTVPRTDAGPSANVSGG